MTNSGSKITQANYVTFICLKFKTIAWDNGYSREEETLGNYLWDEIDKRCNYISNASFMDYRFEIYFTINKKHLFGELKAIDANKLQFGFSIWSTLNKIEKFIGLDDSIERSYIRQLIDDILQLDSSFTEITWTNKSAEELNQA
jgi:hypothetical protein